MRAEGARHNQDKRSAREASSRWFDIPAFPQTPEGFHLSLTSNNPRHISRYHRMRYTPTVERLRKEKEGKPGYHDGTKVSIHPTFDPKHPDVIFYTATPTTYSDFLALSDKHISPKLREQISLSGVQALWFTTEPDGSRKAVFEIRSEHTGIYPGAPGTIGGSIDGKLNYVGSLGEAARLEDASPQHIISHALRETHEELGIPQITLEDFKIGTQPITVNGLVFDRKRKYYDVLLQGTLPYSQTEVQQLYEQHKAAGNDDIHDPMPKRLVFVDATPNSFANLLTKHMIPLTPVTQASFLLAGYMLKMQEVLTQTGNQEQALREAVTWKNSILEGMAEKDALIDEKARINRRQAIRSIRREFFKTLMSHPIKEHAGEKYHNWRREKQRPKGYDTTLMPEKQGLRPVMEELNGAH